MRIEVFLAIFTLTTVCSAGVKATACIIRKFLLVSQVAHCNIADLSRNSENTGPNDGHGLFALENISAGEEFASIPASLALTIKVANASSVFLSFPFFSFLLDRLAKCSQRST